MYQPFFDWFIHAYVQKKCSITTLRFSAATKNTILARLKHIMKHAVYTIV